MKRRTIAQCRRSKLPGHMFKFIFKKKSFTVFFNRTVTIAKVCYSEMIANAVINHSEERIQKGPVTTFITDGYLCLHYL